jgi:hypothetical protein
MVLKVYEKDLPLANMGYTVENNSLRRRAITKEAGHEKEYHLNPAILILRPKIELGNTHEGYIFTC